MVNAAGSTDLDYNWLDAKAKAKNTKVILLSVCLLSLEDQAQWSCHSWNGFFLTLKNKCGWRRRWTETDMAEARDKSSSNVVFRVVSSFFQAHGCRALWKKILQVIKLSIKFHVQRKLRTKGTEPFLAAIWMFKVNLNSTGNGNKKISQLVTEILLWPGLHQQALSQNDMGSLINSDKKHIKMFKSTSLNC